MENFLMSGSQERIEAMLKINAAAIKNLEHLSRSYFDFVARSTESAVSNGRIMASARNPADFMQMQTKILEQCLETITQETKYASQLTASMAATVSEPIASYLAENVPTAKVGSIKKAA